LDAASTALATGLNLSIEERGLLSDSNVYRWAGKMSVDEERLRSRDRFAGRLTDHIMNVSAGELR
jgi:hypothetical protein